MKKFRVKCQCLRWHSEIHEVAAESIEDIDEDFLFDYGECVDSQVSDIDRIYEINNIEEIEDYEN